MVGIDAVAGTYGAGGANAVPNWGAMYWGANAVENGASQALHELAAWNEIGGGAQVVIGIVSVTCCTVCTGTNWVVNWGTRRVTW